MLVLKRRRLYRTCEINSVVKAMGVFLKIFVSNIQGVHKVFRQFKKFIAKAVDEISYINLFYINQCLLKFLVKLKFFVLD